MIGDFLKRAIDFARDYLWVSGDSQTGDPERGRGAAVSGKPKQPATADSTTERSASATSASGGKATGRGKPAPGKAAAKTGAKAETKAQAKSGAKAGSKAAEKGGSKAAQAAGAKTAAKGTPAKSTKAAETARSKPSAGDDLTAIKGIGPALKKDLAGLGVTTIQDLAKADAGELASKLAQRTVTPDKVRGWIAEAQRRA